MVALALPVNSTHLTPVSSPPCARPRLRKAAGVFLCVNQEDMLVDGACLQLKEGGWPHLHRKTAFSRKFRSGLDDYYFNQSLNSMKAILAQLLSSQGRSSTYEQLESWHCHFKVAAATI